MSLTTISTDVENFEEKFGTSDVQCNNGDISVLWATTANINTQNRAYQREKVSTIDWKQSLMLTVLVNTFAGIPEIHIRVIKTEGGGYRYELIDGQQRVTAITGFLNGEYPLPKIVVDGCDVGGMYVTELINTYPKIYQRIVDYRISCKWYEDLTDLQTAHLFIEVLNNVNDMKPQEIRNAVLGFYSDYVRDTARGDVSRQLDPHPLFARYTETKKGVEKEYLKHFSTKFTLNGRMEVDEWLSTLIYFMKEGVSSGVSQPAHTLWVKSIQGYDGMYAAKFVDANKINSVLNFALSLMQSVSTEYKVKLNPMTSLMFIMYALEMQNRGYEVVPEKYAPAFFGTYTRWSDTKLALYTDEVTINGSQMPPFNELFGGKNANAIGTIFKVLDMDFAGKEKDCGLIKIDPRVSFSRADILKKWQEQGGKCFYTGEPIAEDNLAGDHYIPRSAGIDEGGVTEYENLVVCSKRMNIKKSNMHGDEFVAKLKDVA
tara:strand:- start:3136 stop:4596 length:1461 start_codon:yes stop_codon:yes gene_type:complete